MWIATWISTDKSLTWKNGQQDTALACVLLASFHQRLLFSRLHNAHLLIFNLWERELNPMAKSSGLWHFAISPLDLGNLYMLRSMMSRSGEYCTISCRSRFINSTYFLRWLIFYRSGTSNCNKYSVVQSSPGLFPANAVTTEYLLQYEVPVLQKRVNSCF